MSVVTILEKAIFSVNSSKVAFTKFITANDTGKTGGHQAGFHLHKNSYSLFFDSPGIRGDNKEKFVKIRWQDQCETESRFIYYGRGTRNEYRLTRFGKGFPFLRDEYIGSYLVICKIDEEYYEAYILETDEEIEILQSTYAISPADPNQIIRRKSQPIEQNIAELFHEYVLTLSVDFPKTKELSSKAREIIINFLKLKDSDIINSPDREILRWLNTEYDLFKFIENDRYSFIFSKVFKNLSEFISVANSITNRRKSRAGKSLEHHLSFMFGKHKIKFSDQAVTEGNKKPDFIFPDIESYFDLSFPKNKLVFLGAKTTCKDRWRQILNEAERIPQKHLFTLQQGISENQLAEMEREKVLLVVPKRNITTFPLVFREKIWALNDFLGYVKEKQLDG